MNDTAAPVTRGILIATGVTGDALLDRLTDLRLLPLVDRPFVLRAAETLVALGCTQLDVVLGENPGAVRTQLGDGERFGCRIRYHTAPDAAGPLGPCWGWAGNGDERFWMGCDQNLPSLSSLRGIAEAMRHDSDGIALLAGTSRADATWSGWGCFTLRFLRGAALRRASLRALGDQALKAAALQRELAACVWQTRSASALIESQRRFLSDPDAPVGVGLTPRAAGIFVSPRATLHAGTRVLAPAYIGPDCVIGAGATVGPNAVVLAESVIGDRCTVSDALVFPGTYVGPDLSLEGAIVDRDLYLNATLGTALEVPDETLIAPARGTKRAPRVPVWQRLAASALWLVAWPWTLRRRPSADAPEELEARKKALFAQAPRAWREHLIRVVVPRLGAVAAGRIGLTGLELRTDEEIARLEPEWRRLYRRHRMGLVSDSLLLEDDGEAPVGRHMADLYSTANASAAADLRRLAAYAGRLLRERRAATPPKSPTAGAPRVAGIGPSNRCTNEGVIR